MKWLVLIEASGNQRFIFATDKRRENVGASELIERVGSVWGRSAIDQARRAGHAVEEIISAAGKLLLVADSEAGAKALVSNITLDALHHAPGLDVAGIVVSFDDSAPDAVLDASRLAHKEFQSARAARPGPEHRFQQLPCIARCSASGLPAAGNRKIGGRWEPRSASSAAKLDAAAGGYARLADCIGRTPRELEQIIVPWLAASNEDEKRKDAAADWVAVVHADGNALGAVFRTLPSPADFSRAVECCTRWAFRHAVNDTWGTEPLPLVLPLILGGDDLTVVCDGTKAVRFAANYLARFESFSTAEHGGASEANAAACIRQTMIERQCVTASAGVAIVKPHFPFAAAHDLANDLASSAKRAKRRLGNVPASALDFHIQYDSSASELDSIRARLLAPDGTLLSAKPYVLMTPALKRAVSGECLRWAERHDLAQLERRVEIIEVGRGARDGTALPSAQVQQLREALLIGRNEAEQRFRVLCARHERSGVRGLGFEDGLFTEESGAIAGASVQLSGALDAIDAAGFLQGGTTFLADVAT